MPAKTVIQHDCERCGRVWYSDVEKPSTRLLVDMRLSDGSNLHGDFGTLCDSCEKTATNGVKSLLRAMKKNSPAKSVAKKEGTVAPSRPKPVTDLVSGQEKTSAAVVSPVGSSAPSKRS